MNIMKKNWKMLLVCISAILVSLVLFFLLHNKSQKIVQQIPDHATAKIVGDYLTEDDLLTKAPYIYEGVISNISEPFDYGGIQFVKMTFQVSDSLYSQSPVSDSVTILREKDMFTPLEKNKDYILYLYDYEGPIANDVKMICGGNLGAYEIIDETTSSKKTRNLNQYKETVKEYIQKNRK